MICPPPHQNYPHELIGRLEIVSETVGRARSWRIAGGEDWSVAAIEVAIRWIVSSVDLETVATLAQALLG